LQLTIGESLPLAEKPMTAAQAQAAVYFDFEGPANEPPMLLGVAYATGRRINFDKTVLVHYLLDPAFQPLKSTCDVSPQYRYETRTETLRQTLNEVVRLARSRDRLIISWRADELPEIVLETLDDSLASEFAVRYRDGQATAQRWQQALHPDVQFEPAAGGPHSLANYMTLIDYELTDPTYGVDRTGTNLKFIREALARRSSWDHLTERQQARWVEVLGHNAHDCLALRAIVMRAAKELDPTPPQAAYDQSRDRRTGDHRLRGPDAP
jgi:hypothetical protein